MVRRYDIKGSREPLYWGVGFLIVALWCMKDGWFPATSVLAKHPDPGEFFYLFNKSLAILLGIGSLISLTIFWRNR